MGYDKRPQGNRGGLKGGGSVSDAASAVYAVWHADQVGVDARSAGHVVEALLGVGVVVHDSIGLLNDPLPGLQAPGMIHSGSTLHPPTPELLLVL